MVASTKTVVAIARHMRTEGHKDDYIAKYVGVPEDELLRLLNDGAHENKKKTVRWDLEVEEPKKPEPVNPEPVANSAEPAERQKSAVSKPKVEKPAVTKPLSVQSPKPAARRPPMFSGPKLDTHGWSHHGGTSRVGVKTGKSPSEKRLSRLKKCPKEGCERMIPKGDDCCSVCWSIELTGRPPLDGTLQYLGGDLKT